MINLGVFPDFGMLPPEVNSARMYAGPGAGPMMAATSAWDGLAAQLGSTASGYHTAVSELASSGWMGPSSMSMAAAAAPYVAWLSTSAAQAEQAASQARAAAAAYEAAFAMTVPPPMIAENRATLMMLVATNVLGQNTAAIAATEAQYAEMWAQDAAAMYGYAASSSTASALTPFASPPPTTNPAGLAGQSAAVVQGAGTSAGTHAQTLVSMGPQLISSVPQTLQELASPMSSSGMSSGSGMSSSSGMSMSPLMTILTAMNNMMNPANVGSMAAMDAVMPPMIAQMFIMAGQMGAMTGPMGAMPMGALSGPAGASMVSMGMPSVSTGALGSAGFGGTMSASVGQAASIGELSVPNGWVAAAPEIQLAATSLPAGSLAAAAAPAAAATGTGSLFGEMALASMAGRAMAGTSMAGHTRANSATQERAKPTVVVIRSHMPGEGIPGSADGEKSSPATNDTKVK